MPKVSFEECNRFVAVTNEGMFEIIANSDGLTIRGLELCPIVVQPEAANMVHVRIAPRLPRART